MINQIMNNLKSNTNWVGQNEHYSTSSCPFYLKSSIGHVVDQVNLCQLTLVWSPIKVLGPMGRFCAHGVHGVNGGPLFDHEIPDARVGSTIFGRGARGLKCTVMPAKTTYFYLS